MNRPDASPAAFHTQHPGGGNLLFMDGSVRFIKDTVNLDAMRALCTRGYGEIVSADAYWASPVPPVPLVLPVKRPGSVRQAVAARRMVPSRALSVCFLGSPHETDDKAR